VTRVLYHLIYSNSQNALISSTGVIIHHRCTAKVIFWKKKPSFTETPLTFEAALLII